uniref:Uncharacterized protein n=1 Tax=Plectus sambesii TaxID=2011161 RepID=A0A914VPA7_9BILA
MGGEDKGAKCASEATAALEGGPARVAGHCGPLTVHSTPSATLRFATRDLRANSRRRGRRRRSVGGLLRLARRRQALTASENQRIHITPENRPPRANVC